MTPLAPALQNEQPVNTPPVRGSLFADTFGVSALTVAAKVAGAGKSVAIARTFGTGPELDAFLLAFLIPSSLADVFCGSLIPTLVPAFVASNPAGDRVRALAQRWCLYIAGSVSSLILLLSLLLILAMDLAGQTRQTLLMTAIMSPIFLLSGIANIWRAALNAQRRFLLPAASIIVAPSVLIASALLAGSYGVAVLACATTLAVILEVAVLAYDMRQTGLTLFPTQEGATVHNSVWREYIYITAATALSTGGYFLGQSIAASLDAGSLATLNYGTRLTAVLLGIGPAALGVTILPRFAELVSSHDGEIFRRSLIRMLTGTACAGVIIAALLAVGSRAIVRLALQHGAFVESDTVVVAAVQRVSLFQLPFVVCSTLLMRTLAALASNRGLLPVSAVALCANALLNVVLVKPWGVLGLTAATSASQAVLCFALLWLVFKKRGQRFQLSAAA